MRKPRKAKSFQSADETREALIQALLGLLDEHSVADLSVRQIAAAAGVNHGLVHRYFGSKEELVRQAVGRASARVHEEQAAAAGSAGSFAVLRRDPALAHIVARACLDGPHDLLRLAAPPPERLEQIVAPLRVALGRVGLADSDAYLLNALGTAALLGWFVFRPLLAQGYGVPARADDRVAELLARLDQLLM